MNPLIPMRNLIDTFKSYAMTENVSQRQIPKHLYHATFKPLLKKIKIEGIGGKSAKRLWDDSKPGVVYLAVDPNVAYSYTETAFSDNDNIPESWEDRIVVLVIDTDGLDMNKLHMDSNVLDNGGDTLEYHGIIPFNMVTSILKPEDL
jgi:hypothetical protein